jgi:hypothetical protein
VFSAELLVSAVVPAVLLSMRRVRESTAGLAVCSVAVVAGVVWNRLDVSIVAIARPEGMAYFPTWMEIMVTLGIGAAAVLTFLFLAERLAVYDERARGEERRPSYDPSSARGMAPHSFAGPRRYSLVFVGAAALVALILPRQAVMGVRPARTPTAPVRAVDGIVASETGSGVVAAVARLDVVVEGDSVAGSSTRRLLMINGNRNGDLVLFDHAAHVRRVAGADSCAVCHHINLPLDRASSCSGCHRDMYESTDVFNHESHVAALHGNDGCAKCHADSVAAKTRETSTACSHCHEREIAGSEVIAAPEPRWDAAAGYTDAMHGLCITCHTRAVEAAPDRVAANLPRCDTCHNIDYAPRVARLAPAEGKDR